MHNDQVMEWRRLAEHYRSLGDEELRLLALQFGDLTGPAQQALRAELQTRGLGTPETIAQDARPPAPARNAARVPQPSSDELAGTNQDDEEDADSPHDYTWRTVLCECEETIQAYQLCGALERAGIQSWYESPSQGGGRYARVFVPADQLEQARVVASQPIPQDIIDDSKAEPADYTVPNCPGCGAADPVLESADPVNAWHCEVCGRDWTEAVDSQSEGAQGPPAGPGANRPAGRPKDTGTSLFGF